MSRVRLTALPALALVLAGALSSCGDPTEEAPEAEPTASATPSPTAIPSESPTPSEPAGESDSPPPKNLITVTVAGGTITPGPGKIKVPLGEKVSVEVTSDVAEEVHVHGFEKYIALVPGKVAKLTFTADIPGIFEAELEGSGKLLFELEVK